MNKRASILLVIPGTAPGCTFDALHAAQTARALSRFFELDVLCPMLGRQGHVVDFHGARLMRVPLPGQDAGSVQVYARAVRRQLADGIYDAVHVRSALEGEVALELRPQAGFTLVCEPGPCTALARVLRSLDPQHSRSVDARLIRESDLTLVHGPAARDGVLRLGRSPDATADLGHGVDSEVFFPAPLVVDGDPVVLHLHAGSQRVDLPSTVSMGLTDPWGPEYFRPQTPEDLALCLNGSALCVADDPMCLDDPAAPLPPLLLEAAACARPLVAPDLPAVRQALGQGCGPLLFDPKRPEDLACAAARVMDRRTELGSLLADLSLRVRNTCRASMVRTRLTALYSSILQPASDFPARPAPDTGS